jgi:hypothetical protein
MRSLRRSLLASIVAAAALTASGGIAGEAAAAGSATAPDFNGDGFGDLAVGVSGNDRGKGGVQVISGSAAGLVSAGNQFWTQDSAGIGDAGEAGDAFGALVGHGDFNGDGFSDLATSALGEDSGAGAVHVLYGSAAGLTATGSQVWSQDSAGVAGTAKAGDEFGSALAGADFDGDGFDDLAIGVQSDVVAGGQRGGAVQVLYGTAAGLAAPRSQHFDQNDAGMPGDGLTDDLFGWMVAAGDFDDDGFADLAISALGDDSAQEIFVGSVTVLRGSAAGLTTTGVKLFTQDTPAIPDVGEIGDAFGWSLSAGDLNGDGYDDLAIGAPWEGLGGVSGAGAVHVLFGAWNGAQTGGNDFLTPGANGVRGDRARDDVFGWRVLVVEMGCACNPAAYLAVGAPGEDVAGKTDAGYVHQIVAPGKASNTVTMQKMRLQGVGLPGTLSAPQGTGSGLATGDYDGDGQADLAVGSPWEPVAGKQDAGTIAVLTSTATPFGAPKAQQTWHQDSPGIVGQTGRGDLFGWDFATR